MLLSPSDLIYIQLAELHLSNQTLVSLRNKDVISQLRPEFITHITYNSWTLDRKNDSVL